MPIKLLDLEDALEPVEFPNGRVLAVRALDAAGYEKWQAWKGEPRSMDKAVALLTHCMPEATADDLATLSPKMIAAIVAHATHKLQFVLDSLKNFPAPAAAPASRRRSSRRTTRGTS